MEKIAMRTTLRLILPLLVLPAASLPASDREDALLVIDRAIKFQGGEDGLRKAQTGVRKGTGNLVVGGADIPFTDEVTFALPDKVRMAVELSKRIQIITVVNAGQGWQRSGGAANDLGKEHREELSEELYIWWLTTLVPLKMPGVDLSLVPGTNVAGKPATGIKVASKGHREVRMYFDKESGLLVKIVGQTKIAGILVDKEYLYGNYKEFDGVRLYTRLTELINGQKNSELTSATYTLRKPDDTLFAKP